MKRYDPVQFFDQGGSAYGDMEENAEGDYVKFDDAAAEQGRWQDAIYQTLQSHIPNCVNTLDGSGCESGDPLAVTIAEIANTIKLIKHQQEQWNMADTTIETLYGIFELSPDGLMKSPKASGYGSSYDRFDTYQTVEEANQAIVDNGEKYTSYVVLTLKRIVSE